MKVHIFFPFSDGPSGGGNNFLKTLRKEFITMGVYSEKLKDTDVILFNSHQGYRELAKLKKRFPKKTYIHRIDGPMSLYNKKSDIRDSIVKNLNQFLADGSVFQSSWSKEANEKVLLEKPSTVIWNSPDPQFFSKKSGDKKELSFPKIKLVSSGWSTNPNKGIKTLEWIDQNLDFSRYQMDFIGNIDKRFKNINIVPPVPPAQLSTKLKEYDIFIFPSRFEACSNMLLEALHSGLPTVTYRGSSNIEICPEKNWLFENEEEIPDILTLMCADYQGEVSKIQLPMIAETASKYIQFMDFVLKETQGLNKKFSYLCYLNLVSRLYLAKAARKIFASSSNID